MSSRERARLLEPKILRIPHRDESKLDLSQLRWRIALLKDLRLLDLFNPEALISLLRHHSVLPGKPLPNGRKTLLDPKAWKGLFRTHGTDPPDLANAHRGLGAWPRVEAVLLREASATP